MADAGGDDTRPSSSTLGKTRIKRSSVHDHYDQVELPHPSSSKTVNGSQCKLCKATFLNRVSTNLKNHLQAKHPEAFEEVLRK